MRTLSRVLIGLAGLAGLLFAQQGEGVSTTEAQIQELKAQIAAQQKQLESLRTALAREQEMLEEMARPKPVSLGEVASTTPILPRGPETAAARPMTLPGAPQNLDQKQKMEEVNVNTQSKSAMPIGQSPLQLQLGGVTITPIGFMDMTNTFRSTNSGASLATNFGNIPYNNTVGGRLTEDKLSPQNSRIGFRVDAMVHDWHVLGYQESDFVGSIPSAGGAFNTQVSSNSFYYRLRLYWVDVRKKQFEMLGGQSWSMMTPNRRQISPLPGDLFYGQEFDVNYLNGLTWGRIPGFRFLYHPSEKVTMGISFENSSQYFGGSGGAANPTLPTALASLATTQLDASQANGVSIPNVRPDIIAKIAFDPSSRVHFEFAGVTSAFKIFNPNTQQYFSKTGGGGSFNGNFAVVKNLRLITNNFWSDGEGRYLFGQSPDFIVRANGSPSLMHSGSSLNGFEAVAGNNLFYAYYGGIYIGRNVALDTNGSLIGYGYRGSANSMNKTTQEVTFGLNRTFWKDPKYGALSMFVQYAWFFRDPWFVAPGAPKNAHENATWFDLRYTLPGSAPAIEY